MPTVVSDIFALIGNLVRIIGFLVVGFALGRMVFDHFKLGDWRFQAILLLGLFGLLIGLAAFSSPGAIGAFAIGVAVAYFMSMMPAKSEAKEVKNEVTQP